MTKHLALLTLVALAQSTFAADAPGDDAAPDRERTTFDWAVRAVAGGFDGMGVRTDSGGLADVEADLTPKLRMGKWTAEIPLRLDHRQTFGADLNETVVGAGLDLVNRDGKVSWGWLAEGKYTWRPGWPDLYQPDGAGGYLTTDRYSNFQGTVGWRYWNRLGAGRHLRAKVRYVHTVYPRDPNYSEADSVVHLAPRDNGTVKVDLSYRALKKHVGYALKLDGYFRQDFVMLAKNADTGGTSRSNPKQRLLGAEPQAEVQLRSEVANLTLGYGFLSQVDTFEGYYSYTGHNPYARLEVALTRAFSVDLRAEARFLTYGPDSKAATEDGQRLEDTRYALKAGVRYALTKALSVVADGEWTKRETNFCDYGTYVNPNCSASATASPYDIAWDYTNVMATAGLEWKP